MHTELYSRFRYRFRRAVRKMKIPTSTIPSGECQEPSDEFNFDQGVL
ncbi:hypothetical protein LEP1GSC188_3725 [Leptospira weilii serovar Topaz str. LT2116]|uniref:Uncharacterized protein n=1 Tax=Leptospira weilii serovar Topaz str. LT2116 TaxID=1088540 RepID=M3FJM2_9LEPT|nr:hypothetical protein LEP1GSC188_3725 [Leptospira weilii serovar Topaz str. LT2116]